MSFSPQTNSVNVNASAADHKRVAELIEAMEKSGIEQPTFVTYPLPKTIDADVIRGIVISLLGSPIKSRAEVIEKSKTLLVMGYEADHENVKTLLSKLPQGEEAVVMVRGNEWSIATYPTPKLAEDMGLDHIGKFVHACAPDVLVCYDEQRNKIIVMGDRAGHAKVKSMLEQMEKVKSADTPQTKLDMKIEGMNCDGTLIL
jgi:type II secretory pathway component GspD/PulD (secretin)